MKKKTLVALLSAVMVITSMAFGTIAYLTDREEITNTFTVGNVDLKLDETHVDANGDPIVDPEDPTKNQRTEDGNEYHLIPGETYTKDPTLSVVKGSEESYVRMLVTITNISKVRLALGEDFLPQNFVTGWQADKWLTTGVVDEDTDADTAEYEFRYYKTVSAKDAETDVVLEPLFTSFTVPGTITGAELANLANMQIIVKGHAIQTTGFENADAAWTAFDVQNADTAESAPANP